MINCHKLFSVADGRLITVIIALANMFMLRLMNADANCAEEISTLDLAKIWIN